MPSPEELAQIVRDLRSQGLSDSEILETLQDMGVPEDMITVALGGAPASAAPQPSSQEPVGQESESSSSQPTPSSDDLFPANPAPSKDVLSELMGTDSSSPPPQPEPQETPQNPPANDVNPRSDFSASVTTPPILEEESVPAEKLDEIHSKVDALHRALSSSDTLRDDMAEVKEMLRELKRDLHDVKSMFSAIQHLLQQILETDRSILVDLYEKSKR